MAVSRFSWATEAINIPVTLATKFASGPEIEKIRQSFQMASDETGREYFDMFDSLRGQPTQAKLQFLI